MRIYSANTPSCMQSIPACEGKLPGEIWAKCKGNNTSRGNTTLIFQAGLVDLPGTLSLMFCPHLYSHSLPVRDKSLCRRFSLFFFLVLR